MSDTWLEKLSDEECLAHLRSEVVGRIAVITYGLPVILPINYRTVDGDHGDHDVWLLVRTRPGNVIDQGSRHVAFEIDGIDSTRRQGWSVLVRGILQRLTAEQGARLDTDPWLSEERDAWLALQPSAITGRRLRTLTQDWAFPGA